MLLRIKQAFAHSAKTKIGLARALGVTGNSVTQLLAGKRRIRQDEIAKIIKYLELDLVPIVGRVGQGGAVETITIHETEPLPITGVPPGNMQAYEVQGEGMMPRYDAGDLVVVWVDQRKQPVDYVGQEVIARCKDGRVWLRYLDGSLLRSFNAQPVNARIDWICEVYL